MAAKRAQRAPSPDPETPKPCTYDGKQVPHGTEVCWPAPNGRKYWFLCNNGQWENTQVECTQEGSTRRRRGGR